MQATRDKVEDPRVIDVCIYLLPPTGHGAKRADLECLRRIQDLVSVIPCLAKADSFTSEEMADLKLDIKQQLKQNKIHFFNVSNAEIISKLPFSLIGSNT